MIMSTTLHYREISHLFVSTLGCILPNLIIMMIKRGEGTLMRHCLLVTQRRKHCAGVLALLV